MKPDSNTFEYSEIYQIEDVFYKIPGQSWPCLEPVAESFALGKRYLYPFCLIFVHNSSGQLKPWFKHTILSRDMVNNVSVQQDFRWTRISFDSIDDSFCYWVFFSQPYFYSWFEGPIESLMSNWYISGCYKYFCEAGRLHIEVLNITYTCFYPQQIIKVALVDNHWLHTGSLVCPDCQDVCSDQFDKEGQRCKPGILPPKNHVYYEEILTCGSNQMNYSALLFLIMSVISKIYLKDLLFLWEESRNTLIFNWSLRKTMNCKFMLQCCNKFILIIANKF